ncbi:unnamed protein product [Notodromas monacha]|uniref:Uncharacterized protein n=1 Tax=Notodromas monacha TaxID=399045 RepID=A0A7R9GCE3_9CRUS|nr:unnamed protein product [Notodromas monacha]CAG0917571.1 unnamed protein product [Notodromas monacha]
MWFVRGRKNPPSTRHSTVFRFLVVIPRIFGSETTPLLFIHGAAGFPVRQQMRIPWSYIEDPPCWVSDGRVSGENRSPPVTPSFLSASGAPTHGTDLSTAMNSTLVFACVIVGVGIEENFRVLAWEDFIRVHDYQKIDANPPFLFLLFCFRSRPKLLPLVAGRDDFVSGHVPWSTEKPNLLKSAEFVALRVGGDRDTGNTSGFAVGTICVKVLLHFGPTASGCYSQISAKKVGGNIREPRNERPDKHGIAEENMKTYSVLLEEGFSAEGVVKGVAWRLFKRGASDGEIATAG